VAKNSRSNYLETPFSMASLLSMSYLKVENFDYTDKNLNYCYAKISQSKVVSGFSGLGYEFINYSIFDFKHAPSLIKKTFLKSGTALITSQTLLDRIKKDLYYNFLMNHLQKTSLYRNFMLADLNNNDLLYEKTIEQSARKSARPRFVYTHLLMPHFPYYYNSQGHLNKMNDLRPQNLTNDSLYLEYLKYVNGKALNLMKDIVHSNKDAIVVLVSDHGYRYTKNAAIGFSNLSAIYDRKKRISRYHQSISNVNIFPVLFNDLFQANLPFLEDKHFR
jgi:hypothetical protein